MEVIGVVTLPDGSTMSAVASGTVGNSNAAEWFDVLTGGGFVVGDSVWPGIRNWIPGQGPVEGVGASFWVDGVFNRTDATGPESGSQFHIHPAITVDGQVVRAEWVDASGVERFSETVLPGNTGNGGGGPAPDEPVWPTPATTGVLSDGIRTPYTSYDQLTYFGGKYVTSADGEIVEGLDIDGDLEILHDNVTVRYCRILGTASGLDNYPAAFTNSNILVHDVEIDMINSIDQESFLPKASHSRGNITYQRLYTHNCFQGVITYHRTTVEDSYLLLDRAKVNAVAPHREPLLQQGNPFTARNTVFRSIDTSGGVSTSLALYNRPAGVQMKDAIVDGCLIDTEQAPYVSYPAYLGDTHDGVNPPPTNHQVTNNWFSEGVGGSFYRGMPSDPVSNFINNRKWYSDKSHPGYGLLL